MKRIVVTLAASLFLAACSASQNPFRPATATPDPGTGDPATGDASDIPAPLAGDLTRFVYDALAQTLTVEGLPYDSTNPGTDSATYVRNPALDRNGYEAYTFQNSGDDRHFTAYVAETGNASGARAGIVSSGGPRNRVFKGGYFERSGAFTSPTGQVTYTGSYVGLTNGALSTEDLQAPSVVDPLTNPTQAAETTGDISITADFANGAVEGDITNRVRVDDALALPSIVLVSTGITAEGAFNGVQVEYNQGEFPGDNVIGVDIGDFGGVFAGTPGMTSVVGVIALDEFDGPNDPLGLEGEEEIGVFVLDE